METKEKEKTKKLNQKNSTDMTNLLKNFCKGEYVEREVVTHEYRLMYYFGVWMTSSIIYAECDAEAIFDARQELKDKQSKLALPYALWRGNRIVKKFNYEGAAYNPHYLPVLQ